MTAVDFSTEKRRGFVLDDEVLTMTVFLGLTIPAPENPSSEDEAFNTPGCYVKSHERGENSTWPKFFGRLISIDREKNEVIVLVIKHYEPTGVWLGTVDEYYQVWMCD